MNDKELNTTITQIKKELFLYRNGIISDNLKRNGNPYPLIYGIMIPQIKEISNKFIKNRELSLLLWNDCNCRESRLLAIYLCPIDVDMSFLIDLIINIKTREEIEIVCFKLLRHNPFSKELLKTLKETEDKELSGIPYFEYLIEMLEKNQV